MRKIFYTKDNKPILASGIILTYNEKLILQYEYKERAKTKYLSDFGGKLEEKDKCPLYGAIREFIEETNGYLYNRKHNKIEKKNKYKFIGFHFNKFKNIKKSIYIPESKYILFIIEIKKDIYDRIMELQEKFNEIETEGLSHEIIEKEKIEDEIVKIHPRLFYYKKNLL